MENDRKIYEMLKYAKGNVAYYKDYSLDSEDNFNVERIPIIDKKVIQKNQMSFLSDMYIGCYREGRLLIKNTSGTTGEFLRVFWSASDDALANYSVWKYRSKWYNITVGDKYLTFFTTAYFANQMAPCDDFYIEKNHLMCNKKIITTSEISKFEKILLEFKPKWMLIQPTIFLLIEKLIDRDRLANIMESILYVEFTGEYITHNFILHLKEKYPQICFSNMYGTTETGTIALSCPWGCLHVMEKNISLEIVDANKRTLKPGAIGNVIVTSLKNTAMPFIRYSLGDKACISKRKTCDCKSNLPIIDLVAGRDGEYIYSDGLYVPSYLLSAIIESVNYEYNYPIYRANFIQVDEHLIVGNIFIKDIYTNWRRSITDSIRMEFEKNISKKIRLAFQFGAVDKSTAKHPFFKRIRRDV